MQNEKAKEDILTLELCCHRAGHQVGEDGGAPLTQVQSSGQAMGLNFPLPRNALTYSIRMEIIPKMSGKP